ncbi:hypothetical protein [Paraburkholderia fungorum]|uniref:hypothetical protein n=1 Tax=Paraburkholderia fungorum TaxID=134537 RepID=UPI001622BB2B|nr:hypothetical protein [Paraburkholderia fungorum]MBB5547497.1 hypothetical protein [Paraburkholderia fungorum]
MRALACCAGAAGIIFALFGPHAARAECHLKAQTVIMCQAPRNAALAFEEFGIDQARMKISYNVQLLHESWCALVSESPSALRSFELFSAGRVATPSGWVDILHVGFLHDGINDDRYVAAGYISGECRRHQFDLSRSRIDPTAPRSPSLPSIPPGGYKIPDNAGAMP